MELAYLGFEVSDAVKWDQLLTQIIGLSPNGENSDGSRSYRMDEFSQRVFISEGNADDVAAIGFGVVNKVEFERMLDRLRSNNIPFEEGSAADRTNRRVDRLVRFKDPLNNVIELCIQQEFAPKPFASAVAPAGFVTGDKGIGHIILVAPDIAKAMEFYVGVLGLGLSDTASEVWGNIKPEVAFLHANSRHHSIGLVSGVPLPKRVQHFQFEVPSVDAVGLSLDRAREAGVPITRDIGRHPDGALSFYALTPSGFEWEIGTDGFSVGENWKVKHFSRFSVWGHKGPHPAAL